MGPAVCGMRGVRHEGTAGGTGERFRTRFFVSIGMMLTGALILAVFISLAVLNPRIPKMEEMESAAITCRNVSGVPHRSEGLFIDVHSEEGLSAVGRLEYLAPKSRVWCRFPWMSDGRSPSPIN